jgi:hypothetical protein
MTVSTPRAQPMIIRPRFCMSPTRPVRLLCLVAPIGCSSSKLPLTWDQAARAFGRGGRQKSPSHINGAIHAHAAILSAARVPGFRSCDHSPGLPRQRPSGPLYL